MSSQEYVRIPKQLLQELVAQSEDVATLISSPEQRETFDMFKAKLDEIVSIAGMESTADEPSQEESLVPQQDEDEDQAQDEDQYEADQHESAEDSSSPPKRTRRVKRKMARFGRQVCSFFRCLQSH